MLITLKRLEKKGEYQDGILVIDGTTICDTTENLDTRILAGIYNITRHHCKLEEQERKTPVILTSDKMPECQQCLQVHLANDSTKPPHYCPRFKIGNGVHNCYDGRIIVGTRLVPGILEHSTASFNIINERIRKCIERGKSVTLIVKEEE